MKKRAGGKKDDGKTMAPRSPMTKEETAVAKWMRGNVPTKKTKFVGTHIVEYFVASKAIDALIETSPWSKHNAKEGAALIFEFREHCVTFLDELLKHKMFHRAKKIPVLPSETRSKKGKKDNKEESQDDDKAGAKKKRKIRLDMHLDQVFLDSNDAYVWLYDPTPWYYWVGGTAIVLITIAVCLFPLWPPWMRQGVHYMSMAAAGFLVFIIGLGVVKYIVFALLFALSAGKLKLWIFPNLTEDVGFLESFMPLYDYTYTGASKSKKKKKAKESDDEEEEEDESEQEEEEESEQEQDAKKKDAAEHADHSESDDSTSKKSSTGKDFEIVDKNDTD